MSILYTNGVLRIEYNQALSLWNFFWEQTGKEYSKGDSRYAGRDAGVVTVEGLTSVLEGPASILAV